MKLVLKNKNYKQKLILFIILGISVLFFLPSLTETSALAETIPNEGIYYEIDPIRIEQIEFYAEDVLGDHVTTVKPGYGVQFKFNLTPYYATETIYSISYEITQIGNYASIDNNGYLNVSANAVIGNTISVSVCINGVKSEPYILTIVKIPVGMVILHSNGQHLVCKNTKLQLTTTVLPSNASYRKVAYSISEGEDNARIDEYGKLVVLGSSKDTFKVTAEADGKTDTLTFTIFENIVLTANTMEPKVGDIVTLSAAIDGDTSLLPDFCITAGGNYCTKLGNEITIKSNIDGYRPYITVYAVYDNLISQAIRINIRIPITSIELAYLDSTYNLIKEDIEVKEGSEFYLNTQILPSNYTDSVTIQITSGTNYASLAEDGKITTYIDNVTNKTIVVQATNSKTGNELKISNELTIAIEKPIIILTVDTILPEQGSSVNLTVTKDGEALATPNYVIQASSNNLYSISGNILQIDSNITSMNPKIIIYATDEQNNASNEITLTIIIPIDTVTISSEVIELVQGEKYQLNRPTISPANATVNSVLYFQTGNSGFATINWFIGEIIVNNNINIPDAQISVCVVVNGNKQSNSITFSIYNPASNITLSADKMMAIADETITLSGICDLAASDNEIEYSITSGNDYASIIGNKVTVKAESAIIENLMNSANNDTKLEIVVSAKRDGISVYLTLKIFIPITRISLIKSLDQEVTSVHQQESYSVKIEPSYANAQALSYSLNVGNETATISDLGQLSIATNADIDKIISIELRSKDFNGKDYTHTCKVVVERVYATNIELHILKDGTDISKTNSVLPADLLTVNAKFTPENTTDKTFTIDDMSAISQISGNTISIKALKDLTADVPSFTIRFANSKFYKTIEVYVPVNIFSFEEIVAERGETIQLIPHYNINDNATEKRWKPSGETQGITFETSAYGDGSCNNSLFIDPKVKEGNIIFKYCLFDNPSKEYTDTITVKKLDLTKFTFAYSKDNEERTINPVFPQLEVGCSTIISTYYDGKPISNYGFKSRFTSNPITFTFIPIAIMSYEGENIKLTAQNVFGKNLIIFTFIIINSQTSESYEKSNSETPIHIFKALKLSLIDPSLITESTDLRTRIKLNAATANFSALQFEIAEGIGYKVKDGFIITSGDKVASDEVIVKVTIIQSYNGLPYSSKNDYQNIYSLTFTRRFINCRYHLTLLAESSETWYITSDLDLWNGDFWNPIATFSGILEGQDHKIKNLEIKIPINKDSNYEKNYGLFAELKGTVKNLEFFNSNIDGDDFHNGKYCDNVGIVAGSITGGTIINVKVIVALVTCCRNKSNVGGIVGCAKSSTISDCFFLNVGIEGSGKIGGIAGKVISSTIENCDLGLCGIAICANNINCAVGLILGYGENTTIKSCSIVSSSISLIKYENFSTTFTPSIGILAGSLNNCNLNCGKEDSVNYMIIYDITLTDTQKIYIQKGSWGQYGYIWRH